MLVRVSSLRYCLFCMSSYLCIHFPLRSLNGSHGSCISVFIQMIENESLGDFIVLEKRNKSDLIDRYVAKGWVCKLIHVIYFSTYV